MDKSVIIYSDGGARGNPGPAAAGVVIYASEDKKAIETISEYLGELTNNQAEYRAVGLGLAKARELGAQTAVCYLDSELVVKQLTLKYKVKNHQLGPYFVKVWNLVQQFKKVEFKHISREQNKVADRLVNEALDKKLK
ncbi:MAG: ribonuclease HI family protein [Patescibacteria group bacterium]|nr:ribonuclease HI family protein [Patescibacteria group bacterium]